MRVLETRFLRGPNVHDVAPCFVSVIEFDGHAPADPDCLAAGAAYWQTLLPGTALPQSVDDAALARLLTRLMSATQAWAGGPTTFCDTVHPTTAAPGRYRLVCGYRHEAVAEKALRLSVDLLTALLEHRPFDLGARLGALQALSDACSSDPPTPTPLPSAWASGNSVHRMPVLAVTGTNGKTTTTQLIAHVLRASGLRTGATTTQGIYIDGRCVKEGDCSGHRSARRVLADRTVEVAILETARGGILKRGLAFDRCDVAVVLNVSSDHLGLDGVETLQDLAHVKGVLARSARAAAVLNADDASCVAMRETLAAGCKPVFFTMDPMNAVWLEHLRAGGAGTCLDDDGWLVWCSVAERSRVVKAVDLPFTWHGHARYNIANALAALAALTCLGCDTAATSRALSSFVSDAKANPLRGNRFEVDGVGLIVDYAHNAAAYRALCGTARSLLSDAGRLVGVVTSPGDRRPEDLFETGQVCGTGFDELVVYEHDPRGRAAGATCQEILRGARHAAPAKPLHGEPRIRRALWRGLTAARRGDLVVFTCAGGFADVVEGVRLKCPVAAERIAREISP